ncbi:transcription accessory protein [Stenotrophomonas ginsengisoli]|uniref:Transcription accessory protein n=1 Tax=Stenotrophomonas ginsengisoli TaxID=336566 RepID=A0A0R0CZU7_9GAMM|nr:Tex family protein [Stenotrophomonas ginsengisoli]KRG75257.1 transcription accessory protein [Stenotrophomonas ginsengisoli]
MHIPATDHTITAQLASEVNATATQVMAATRLLDDGATVPFIARYRKEATGGLDDGQLRTLQQRLIYLRELEQRRAAILASIQEQDKLEEGLRQRIAAAGSKALLEDLYLPYKPRRRTRAQMAREAGLEPLAQALLAQPQQSPEQLAGQYVDAQRGVADIAAALEGARHILIEGWSEQAGLLGALRSWFAQQAVLQSRLLRGKEHEAQKYRDYFAHDETLAGIASHRLLALLRGEREGLLRLELVPGRDAEQGTSQAIALLARHAGVAARGRPADAWLWAGCERAWKDRLHGNLSTQLLAAAREQAQAQAIAVFSANLGDLLLAAPAGRKVVLGVDPGIRTGCKLAVVDDTGKLLDTATIYPHEPRRQWAQSLAVLEQLCQRHQVALVAIGNGTASRETDTLVSELLTALPAATRPRKVVVSEAGASVYSASELAANELPQLDVSLRGAVSIARRLQDPLAELVKIEPKAIGVGQYQHDVDQNQLAQSLDARLEDCVNAVGVDVNTASAALLEHVAGVNSTVAANIVAHRDTHGAFRRRRDLLKVARLGPRCYEQCAGFLRIHGGDEPLDASAVHPEAYPLVARILDDCGKSIQQLIGDRQTLRGIDPARFVDASFGLPTVRDILQELEKPGRDPRPEFVTVRFDQSVQTLADLKVGMWLEGVVSNVAAFGAFVDIGVHQDGLVHISQLAEGYIKDPRQAVKAGQVVKVRVVEVDVARKRIALSCRAQSAADAAGQPRADNRPPRARADDRRAGDQQRARPQAPAAAPGALALALAQARGNKPG